MTKIQLKTKPPRMPAEGEGEKVRNQSSHTRIWGAQVMSHGYTGVPNVLLRSQHRLGLNNTQMMIVVQLLSYWFDPSNVPFPTKQQLADRLGIKKKTIQTNMKALEDRGYLKREQMTTSQGDYGSNRYHLKGLIRKVKELEVSYAEEKAKKTEARRSTELPAHKRPKP
ncbi:MAG: helix-turn-helix domain-containing protein [Hyphomonas sp.]|uniref:helix-turn-helix domain-containing protein n=1 Tax=Hyphomonas sp. BRH_c22 TaxID=1629710 RepID=UPI000B1E1746|nr:helix-turn-helix domain-containing protein [Hyphomonas sp. BRH_c22]